ncbi:MAG TPA: DUF1269 domain-containing protein [Terriglobales bacterium]|nr:DUF1269 domain-containing protein [Terriglobales bacterium]HXY49916.1 DUF1269 domain-containing protein [Terriglobales bacterium]
MDRMLVVVFDNETKAYEGRKALMQLEAEGSVFVYAYAVLAKNADGTTTLTEQDEFGPIGTLLGLSFGSLIGMLGGPVGVAVGFTTGALAGGAIDDNKSLVGEDFIEDVKKALTPSTFALVAEIDEKWTLPVDTRMEAISGTVFRRAVSEVKQTIYEEHVNAMKADLAEMKAEQAQANADRKAKLHEKIYKLESKIQAQLQKAKERRETAEREAQAKVQLLKQKAAVAKAKAS